MNDPFGQPDDGKYRIEFAVPQVHQLLFTEDCFGDDFSKLTELFATHVGSTARLMVFLDSGLIEFDPGLGHRIQRLIAETTGIELVSDVMVVPGGEAIKNDSDYVDNFLKEFNAADLDRRSYVLCIGGGALLDAVGYAAAIAHRGIRLVRFPTTTLAQADSGVGVKNAVNWFGKKNWKGTFATPWAVVNDRRLLSGLSDRDFRCGFSEAVKVALLKDPTFFSFLHSNAAAIAARSWEASAAAIRQSVLLHLWHITRGGDPFELREARPLDFGHWSAHKLETLANFDIRHGEAVAVGVAVDVAYSHLTQGLSYRSAQQTLATLNDLRLPLWDSRLDAEAIFDGLEEFRQHLGGQLTITLIKDVGCPVDVHKIDRTAMREAMKMVSEYAQSPSKAAS